jgi:hypothetical protein
VATPSGDTATPTAALKLGSMIVVTVFVAVAVIGCCRCSSRLRDRWFADSLLEGNGFEPSVPQ